MPKKHHAKTFRRASPAGFLAELGILRVSPEQVFTPEYWQMVSEAGGDPRELEKHGPFSSEAGKVFFVTEEVASSLFQRSTAGSRGCLTSSIASQELFPSRGAVADLGGGVGIVSLYLARCHPRCRATVYDHAAAAT